MIKIFGFGTLVLLESALQTCPNLKNFEPAMVKNAARVFGKVNLRAAHRGDVNWESMEVASCFLEDMAGHDTIGVCFDIPVDEWPLMRAREIDYDCRKIEIFDLKGNSKGHAITFYGFDNDDAFMSQLNDGDHEYLRSRRGHYQGNMYRDGIYPGEDYLQKCFRAHHQSGALLRENFLDHSLLSDRTTTMRAYLDTKTWDDMFIKTGKMPDG